MAGVLPDGRSSPLSEDNSDRSKVKSAVIFVKPIKVFNLPRFTLSSFSLCDAGHSRIKRFALQRPSMAANKVTAVRTRLSSDRQLRTVRSRQREKPGGFLLARQSTCDWRGLPQNFVGEGKRIPERLATQHPPG